MMISYTAFLLDEQERAALLEKIPPKYPCVKADHITVKYGASGLDTMIAPESLEIVGVSDDGKGIQALIVEVNGNCSRPDNSFYHITWSFDPDQTIPADWMPLQKRLRGEKVPYAAKHANDLMREVFNRTAANLTLFDPITITPDFVLITNHDNGTKSIEKMPTLPVPPKILKP